MLLFIIFVVCVVALVMYGRKLRRNLHKSSLDAYVGDLGNEVDGKLDDTLLRAKVVAMENGIDIHK
jgi:hypothetical protein